MALILELLDARGGVRSRVPLDTAPVVVGRALDSDLVVDDPYVDARHARIRRGPDGEVLVEDLGSVNGVVVAGDGRRQPTIRIHHGTELRLGRTRVRFRDTAEPVPPALPDRVVSRFAAPRWLATLWGRTAFVAVAVAVFAFLTYMESFQRAAGTNAMYAALGVLVVGGLWAGIWAVGSRIVVQRFNYSGHLATVMAVVLGGMTYALVADWAAFLFPDSALWAVLGWAVGLALFAALIAVHLRFASHLPARRRWSAGVAGCAALGGIVLAFTLAEGDTFTDIPTFSGTIQPFPTALVPTVTTDEFGDEMEELRVEIDALAREREG